MKIFAFKSFIFQLHYTKWYFLDPIAKNKDKQLTIVTKRRLLFFFARCWKRNNHKARHPRRYTSFLSRRSKWLRNEL